VVRGIAVRVHARLCMTGRQSWTKLATARWRCGHS